MPMAGQRPPPARAYDGFGERVLIGIAGGGTHDIFGLGGELLAENNSLGQPQRSYIYLNGVPLAVVDGFGNISYVLSGQLGQPQKMADGFGNLTWDMIADEFGQLVSQPVGQTGANSLRFPGQVNDAATALYYNYYRDYDPSLGRYIQTDPIGLEGGINPYGYVGANPLRWTDRLGLCKVQVGYENLLGSQKYHTYVVTKDPNGSVKVFHAYPQNYPYFWNWGNLEAAFDQGDSHNSPTGGSTPSSTVFEDGKPCTCENAKLQQDTQAINDAKIPYSLLKGPNSNSAVSYALQSLGINFTPTLTTPGWGTPLPMANAR